MLTEVEVTVDAAATEVFDAMADARNEPQWNSQVSSSELVTEGDIGRGSMFRTVNRGQPYDAVITEYERPTRLTFEVTGKQMTIVGSMQFESRGEAQTLLRAQFDMRPKGFMKVLLPLLSGAIRKDFPKQFESFKRFCESRV